MPMLPGSVMIKLPKRDFKAIEKRQKAKEVKKASNVAYNAAQAALQGIKTIQPDYKSAMKQVDDLCSYIVRRRDSRVYLGKCLICVVKSALGVIHRPARMIQVAYHIFSRSNLATRHDLRNLVGACSPCNLGELKSRGRKGLEEVYERVHIALIGEQVYNELKELAKKDVKFSAADLIELRDVLKKQAEAGI